MRNLNAHNDNELLHLLSKDNEAAFTEVYNRFWQKMFVVAHNRLKDVQAAEDIVHDVFLSLWKNRKSAEINSLENYLASATKYMVLAKIKKVQMERTYHQSQSLAPVVALPDEPSIHYKRILEMVHDEVEKLPERCRLIFQYSRTQGLPVKEIARELNISPKTVENQLNKALKQLRLALKNYLSLLFSSVL